MVAWVSLRCLRLICITLSVVRRFLQYPMADQLWQLVCSQVRISAAAGWIPGVRQVNWSQCMHIERQCIEVCDWYALHYLLSDVSCSIRWRTNCDSAYVLRCVFRQLLDGYLRWGRSTGVNACTLRDCALIDIALRDIALSVFYFVHACVRADLDCLLAVVPQDPHRGLHLSTAHRRITVHLHAYACHCKIRLYPLIFCVLR